MGSINGDELTPWDAGSSAHEEKIFVSVRLRPLSDREISKNDTSDWECINTTTVIFKSTLPERAMFPTAYSFDRVFGCESSTRQVYEEAAKRVALSVVSGINSSIFAYGQTSSGKTYTMRGVTEFTVADIYDYIDKHDNREHVLKFSAIEIYNESVRDLLSSDSTPLRLLDDPERGTVVEKLTEVTLTDQSHLKELLSVCEAQRQIGETSLNEMSSRSHQILRLTVESSAREYLGSENSSTLAATVNFVDLAGSERASQTLSAGTRLKEGCHINRSLLTLGTVIRKLSKGKNAHVPYRDSKLTRILQNSLGGNARTAIICTMSPAHTHVEQSRNTLLFASCAKQVSTNAQVNVVMSEKALVKQLQRELVRLESELRNLGTLSGSCDSASALKEKELLIEKMDKEIKELTQQRDLAQSRVEDLLRSAGKYQTDGHWVEVKNHPESHEKGVWPDEYAASEVSEIIDPLRSDAASIISHFSDRFEVLHSEKHEEQFSEEQFLSDDTSPRLFIDKYFGPDPSKGWEKIAQGTDESLEDNCKEVRCIETDSTFINIKPDAASSPTKEDSDVGDIDTLKQKVQDMQKTIDGLVDPYCVEQSPCSSETDMSDSSINVSRSISCRARLTTTPSPTEIEINKDSINSAPTEVNEDTCETPGRYDHICSQVDSATSENPCTFGSASPINSEPANEQETDHEEDAKSETGVQNDMVQNPEANSCNFQKTTDVGSDTRHNSDQSPSNWSLEFEKQMREIIELWDACNIPLVHRTYFFLLFKGDPSDSVYLQVELRRLSFLKKSLSQGSIFVKNGQIFSVAASMRDLKREKEMLSRQILKKFSSKDREALYQKWGIGLKSKQRRLQLTRRLWKDTKNMDHIKESAALVARLVGFPEASQAPKEMFGLSFAPRPVKLRSHSWKHGLPSMM